jgi:hypothetical protein
MSVTNSSDTIGNRTRDLPAYGAALQPTYPYIISALFKFNKSHHKLVNETVASDAHQIRILNLVLLLSILASNQIH